MPFVKSPKHKPATLKATTKNIARVEAELAIGWRQRLMNILKQRGVETQDLNRMPMDELLIEVGVPVEKLDGITRRRAEQYAIAWAKQQPRTIIPSAEFSIARAREVTGTSEKTFKRYRAMAGVPAPKAGSSRTHKFTGAEMLSILRAIVDHGGTADRERAKRAIENLTANR